MKLKLISAATALALLAGCSTTQDPLTGRPQANNTAGGAIIGAGVGAVTGLLVGGDNKKDQRKAALVGAGIGALVGGGIGNYMDRQEEELRAELRAAGVSVTRAGDQIIINLPSNVTFATDQDSLNPAFYGTLDSVAIILNKYPKTLLDIDGHTDNVGNDQYNFDLSQRRAVSVGNYLASRSIDPRRLMVAGFGETRPVATNASEDGRSQNRRVEIRISPLS